MNEHMTIPTPEQEATVSAVVADLDKAANQAVAIKKVIGTLRQELSESLCLLAKLREVIGPGAYVWNDRTRWVDVIDKRASNIKEALK